MGALWFGVSHPIWGLCGRLVFLFRLVSKCVVGGWSTFLSHLVYGAMLVGWDEDGAGCYFELRRLLVVQFFVFQVLSGEFISS